SRSRIRCRTPHRARARPGPPSTRTDSAPGARPRARVGGQGRAAPATPSRKPHLEPGARDDSTDARAGASARSRPASRALEDLAVPMRQLGRAEPGLHGLARAGELRGPLAATREDLDDRLR